MNRRTDDYLLKFVTEMIAQERENLHKSVEQRFGQAFPKKRLLEGEKG